MRRVLGLLLSGLSATVVVAAPATAHATGGRVPAFEPGACPEGVPADPRVECGTVTVPEDRGVDGGRQVVLAVATIHAATAESAEPPLLYVSGGPGDASLAYAAGFLDVPLVQDRDTVLVDLRGTGFSTPSLACPEATGGTFSFEVPSDDKDGKRARRESLLACKDRLEDEGIDLRAYDYRAMAADLADVRVALGIDALDVYGISNGGRLALELVRRHPEGIRALVLDAASAPQGNFFTELWPNADHAFGALFEACASDAACGEAHPDLEDRFSDLVEQLRESPRIVTGTDPTTGEPGTVVFDDRNALEILRSGLYDSSLLPAIPSLIDSLTKGEAFDIVAGEVLAGSDTSAFSLGQNLSDLCREEVAYAPRREFVRQARELPRFRRVILDDTFRDDCRIWDVGRADSSIDEPVRSEIPALVLVGELDPVHPRSSSDAIAESLPNSTVVEIPAVGHGTVDDSECARSIMQAFLSDPDRPVDTACVATLPPLTFS